MRAIIVRYRKRIDTDVIARRTAVNRYKLRYEVLRRRFR